jgi:chromate transporter
MLTTLWHLVLVFARLSVLAVGGGLPILPEMQRLTVEHYQWLSNAQFRDTYSLGQVTPGPGMLMSVAIGYKAAGITGGLVAGIALFLPSSILTLVVGHHWDRFAKWPWRMSLQRGLGPVVIGLMAAGAFALAQTAILGAITAVIAAVTILTLLRTRLSPALLVLAGGIAGLILLR